MYFVAMLINLEIPNPRMRLTVQQAVYAHAAIINAILGIDPKAGYALHEMKRNKRMTIAALHERGQHPALRLTFFTETGLAYANTLINALSTRPVLQLGVMTCEIKAVNLTASQWTGVGTWSDFISENPSSRLGFRFVTPCSFAKKDKYGRRFFALLPDPVDVFVGLERRWRALAGPVLPDGLEDFIRAGGCIISSHWLRSLESSPTQRPHIGFVGQVVYECPTSDKAMIGILNSLALMAEFTGIGYHTMQGMGTVQVKQLG